MCSFLVASSLSMAVMRSFLVASSLSMADMWLSLVASSPFMAASSPSMVAICPSLLAISLCIAAICSSFRRTFPASSSTSLSLIYCEGLNIPAYSITKIIYLPPSPLPPELHFFPKTFQQQDSIAIYSIATAY